MYCYSILGSINSVDSSMYNLRIEISKLDLLFLMRCFSSALIPWSWKVIGQGCVTVCIAFPLYALVLQ
jgi:hypothetical protein